jgi:hypothetical protein
MSCGCLSPVALVIRIMALRQEPKGFAIAGVVISILGFLPMVIVAIPFLIISLGLAQVSNTLAKLPPPAPPPAIRLHEPPPTSDAAREVAATDLGKPVRNADQFLTESEVRRYVALRADLHARIIADAQTMALMEASPGSRPTGYGITREGIALLDALHRHEAAALAAAGMGDSNTQASGARIYATLRSSAASGDEAAAQVVAHVDATSPAPHRIQRGRPGFDAMCRRLKLPVAISATEVGKVRVVAPELAVGLPAYVEEATLLRKAE